MYKRQILKMGVNARDAMLNGGRLRLSAEAVSVTAHRDVPGELADGNYIVIHVEDSGVGIPAPLLDKIFDPFFTTKEAGKGTGLGLSIARWAAQLHGGTVKVVDDTRGADFEIILPKYHIAER